MAQVKPGSHWVSRLTYLGIDEDDEIDLTVRGWRATCPRSSRIRTFDHTASPPTSVTSKSFIANHAAVMNLCDHPELIPIHGVMAGRNPHVRPLTPIFSLSKTELHADILGVPTEFFVDDLDSPPWGERTEERLLWRGSNTGAWFDASTTWRSSHRVRLLRLANRGDTEGGEGLNILAAPKRMRGQTISESSENLGWGEANDHYMDMAFTRQPLRECHITLSC